MTAAPDPTPTETFDRDVVTNAKWWKSVGVNATLVAFDAWEEDGLPVALAAQRFRDSRGVPERRGWCIVDRPFAPIDDVFPVDSQRIDQLLVLGWRVDKVAIPKRRIAHEAKIAEAEWCRREGKSRCPKAVATDIKDTIERQLLRDAVAETTVYPVLVDPDAGRIHVQGAPDKEVENILGALRGLGFDALPTSAEDVCAPGLAARLCQSRPDDIRNTRAPGWETDAPGVDAVLPGHLGPEFLLWLWYRAHKGNGTGLVRDDDGSTVEWWIEGPLELVAPQSRTVELADGDGDDTVTEAEKPGALTLRGSDPDDRAAALAALAEGYLPTSLRVGIRIPTKPGEVQDAEGNEVPAETLEFHATLRGYGAKSVGLPAVVKVGGPDDVPVAVWERVHLFDRFNAARDRLWLHFAGDRVERWEATRAGIREWIGLKLASRFVAGPGGQGLLFGQRTFAALEG